MKHIDLFSGIGGFSLAASWVWGEDHEVVCFCEQDKFCQKVLNKHWPDVMCYPDIETFDCSRFKDIDLISGGFPCQDISVAGKGGGIDGKRSGLWNEMFRIIRGIRPKHVIIENSAALLVRGGERVLSDLASIGFNAEWQIISAKEVGAPHLRRRIYIVAYPNQDDGITGVGDIFNREKAILKSGSRNGSQFWLQAPRARIRVDDGIPPQLYRMAVESLGNSIVPQVAYEIMMAIKETDEETAPIL
jgi:DNA (cytosine-5)-methyltransferase 1